MNTFRKLFFCSAFIFLSTFSFAQQRAADSIASLIRNYHSSCSAPCISDTLKAKYLNSLAWNHDNSDSSVLYSTAALHLFEAILSNNKDPLLTNVISIGIGSSHFQLGCFYDDKDDYSLSMQHYSQALELWRSLLINNQDKAQIRRIKGRVATALGNIGIIYRKQGNYPKALDCYFQALKADEAIDSKKDIATDLGNIGVVYYKLKNYPKTLEYFIKAKNIDESIGNKNGVSRHLGNIGGLYGDQHKYEKALECYFQALKIAEELNNKQGIARHLGNIGSIYFEKQEYEKALAYFFRSLKIREALDSKVLIASGLRSIGVLYTKTNKFSEAESYLKRSLAISAEIGSLEDLKDTHQSLSELYIKTGNYQKALDHYQKTIVIKDSLFNADKNKEITRKELTYEFDKKAASTEAEQEKKNAVAEVNSKKQQLILIFVSICLLLVFVFSGFIFRALKITRKQKKLIENKNRQTEAQKKIIEEQKEMVEERNKDIIDSINYAKRIQDALLKEQEHVSKHLPEHFILFKPKDIVSGDFYWTLEKENKLYIAAVDCTGHGVPGAFMSMLGVAFLNEITAAHTSFSPAEILDQLRDKVVKDLKQTGKNSETKDGMDMSIVCLDLAAKELQWAGANNPLYIFKNKALTEIKPDKQCIGYDPKMSPFKNHSFQLEAGTSFYLFTDGYADQFGGAKGKKFKYNQLKELLSRMQEESILNQKKILNDTFISWKGELEQVDDVCVIGVKL